MGQIETRFLLAVLVLFVYLSRDEAKGDELKVSQHGRHLVTSSGQPFFYLGDTAWELFHRLNREQAEEYLGNRARKGFTVIQAVALAELGGLTEPNAYGHLPLVNNDPTRPNVSPGKNNDYWDHVDYIVDRAESLGLYIAMLPERARPMARPFQAPERVEARERASMSKLDPPATAGSSSPSTIRAGSRPG